VTTAAIGFLAIQTLGIRDGAPIRACYAQRVIEECEANVVPLFLIVVIICNGIKGICFLLTLYVTKKDPPLCIIGDAIQSFINEPDIHTRHCCLASKEDYETLSPDRSSKRSGRWALNADTWKGGRRRWITAVNQTQWWIYTILWAVAVTLVALLVCGILNHRIICADQLIVNMSLPKGTSLTASMLLANFPQILMSYIYLGLNNIMNTILAMNE
jgi:hypothetical protein